MRFCTGASGGETIELLFACYLYYNFIFLKASREVLYYFYRAVLIRIVRRTYQSDQPVYVVHVAHWYFFPLSKETLQMRTY